MLTLPALFAAAFVAATLIPFQSEPVFVALQIAGTNDVWLLVVVASIANTLGSCVNYALGRGALTFRQASWFPVNPERLARAQIWFQRWGMWVLLLSWAPVGDVVTVIAGTLRTPVLWFVLLVGIGKTLRYVALAMITAGVMG